MEPQSIDLVAESREEQHPQHAEETSWYDILWRWLKETLIARCNDHRTRWELLTCSIVKLLILHNFVSSIFMYSAIQEAFPFSDFSNSYLAFLIIAFIYSVWPELITQINPLLILDILMPRFYDYYGLPNLKFNSSSVRLLFGIFSQDAPCTIIILCTMLFGHNCGFLISLTYRKIAKLSLLLTFINCFRKLTTISYEMLKVAQRESMDNDISLKVKISCMLFIILTILFPPLIFVLIIKFPQSLNRPLSVIIALPTVCLIASPIYISFLNVYFIFNIGSLANLSGCTPFKLAVDATTLFLIEHSRMCNEERVVKVNKAVLWELNGDKLLSTNYGLLNTSCKNVLYPEYLQSLMLLSPVFDGCEFWMSFSYSTDIFEPSFNYAIQLHAQNRSICTKPVLETPIVVQWPLGSVAEVIIQMCNETQKFTQCLGKPKANNLMCIDCANRCYNSPSASANLFQGFQVALTVNGVTKNVRYNSNLTTACDVIGDLKSVKYICY